MENNKPLVSIYCSTYNQIDYIESAIKGFLSQKTDFDYEVIIHDDASTDGTTDIVMKYAKMYPDIIKPIIEKENKYSKNIDVSSNIIANIKAKYVAFCDGDDYWIDDYKLQTQVDYMKNHLKCVCCGTEALCINCETGEKNLFWGGGNVIV